MKNGRHLILNADDFGQSDGVNRGIVEAYENGIVTSASLMVRGSHASEAAAYAREHPDLSLGLHVDLCEWKSRDGAWEPLYEVVPLDNPTKVASEISDQLMTFRRLRSEDPTHIDSHQHVHREEPVRSILTELAYKLRIPLRDSGAVIRHCGKFHGQNRRGMQFPERITVDALLEILVELPAGVTELGCHPGLGDDLDATYRNGRIQEVATLCDPRVRTAIDAYGIVLCSFRGIQL